MSNTLDIYQEAFTTTFAEIGTEPFEQGCVELPAFNLLQPNFKAQSGTPAMTLFLTDYTQADTPTITTRSGQFTASVSDDIATSAEYRFAYPQVAHIRLPFQDVQENMGKNQIKDRVSLHSDATIYQCKSSINTTLYTANGSLPANSFSSFDTLCNDSVHSVGGIDWTVSGQEYWKPFTTAASGDPKKILRLMWDTVRQRGNGVVPDVILSGTDFFTAVRDYLDDRGELQNIGGVKTELEWDTITYDGVKIVQDFTAPASKLFVLKKSALFLRYLNDLFLSVQKSQPVYAWNDGNTSVDNTLDTVIPVVSVLALGTNRRRSLGMATYTV